jgi:hypothetical protein
MSALLPVLPRCQSRAVLSPCRRKTHPQVLPPICHTAVLKEEDHPARVPSAWEPRSALSGQEDTAMSARSLAVRLARWIHPPDSSSTLTPVDASPRLALTAIGEPLNGSLTPEVPWLKGSRTVRFQAREGFVCACTPPFDERFVLRSFTHRANTASGWGTILLPTPFLLLLMLDTNIPGRNVLRVGVRRGRVDRTTGPQSLRLLSLNKIVTARVHR